MATATKTATKTPTRKRTALPSPPMRHEDGRPIFGAPRVAPPAAPSRGSTDPQSVSALPAGAVARQCSAPERHAGWWYVAPSVVPGAVDGDVVCGLCEYPGISPTLRQVLSGTDEDGVAGTPDTRRGLVAVLLAWGEVHDWPRLSLAEPYLWLLAGETHWRRFVGGNAIPLLRRAVVATEAGL